MKKCCICNQEITTEEPAIIALANTEYEICTKCENNLDALNHHDKPEEIKGAENYFYNLQMSGIIKNHDVLSFIAFRTAATNHELNETRDFFTDRKYVEGNSASIWISYMKIVSWISSVGTILIGLGFGTFLMFDESVEMGLRIIMGLGIFVTSIIIAFFEVSMMMIFLDLASDVSKIRQALCKKDIVCPLWLTIEVAHKKTR